MPAARASRHRVDITVTIEQAIQPAEDRSTQGDGRLRRKRTQSTEVPKAQHYFHSEYRLLPEDSEIVKADVVTFGRNAKVYTDTDSKVLQTWREGDLVYFAWSQSRRIEVTKDILLGLFNYTLQLHIWDNKEKVSPRARFDRPKGFKTAHLSHREPSTEISNMTDALESYPLSASPFPQNAISRETKSKQFGLGAYEGHIPAPASPSSFRGSMIGSGKQSVRPGTQLFSPDTTFDDASHKDTRKDQKQQKSGRPKQQDTSKQEIAVLRLPMAQLFAGRSEISVQLTSPAGALQDAKITVSVDGSLMNEKQKLELNPMSILVRGATNMPEQPVAYNELRQRCLPAYCLYTLFKRFEHKTTGRAQNKNILWEETSVILLGTLDRALVIEWLCGLPFVIEVHDRDRRDEEVKQQPAVFGKLTDDDQISSINLIGGRQTTHNPFKGLLRPWDPYGIAKFSLSELLHGICLLSLSSPILNCPRPNPNDDHVLVDLYSDNPNANPMPAGKYIESGSELKVKIELAHPLISPHSEPQTSITIDTTTTQCPYARIIYIFPSQDEPFLNRLVSEVTEINAAALGFHDLPRHVTELALSTYKLSSEQQHDKQLDIITGFQVEDEHRHIFILEGLAKQGIQTVWTKILYPESNGTSKALYSSDMAFSERLYATLDVDLCHVRLHEPLSYIVSQPLVYVRDMIPQLCYDALMALDNITRSTKLADVARNGLFPTSEMIVALNQEFGVMTLKTTKSQRNEEAADIEESGNNQIDVKKPEHIKTSRIWTPIDNQNESYLETLAKRNEQLPRNHVKMNMTKTGPSQKKTCRWHSRSQSEDLSLTAHNYSIQTLNSTVQSMNRLRNALERGRLYTYGQDYHSMTLVPEDLDQEQKLEQKRHRKSWRTAQGFTYPGVQTSLESNKPPLQLHSARQLELTGPWEENVLHANKLKPTVDRMRFSWPQRRQDMDLWRKPPSFFGVSVSTSLDESRDSTMQTDLREKKLPPFKTHRLSTQTESTEKGLLSSNQVEKLKGLLKDPPNRQWMRGSEVPNIPLSVVEWDGVVEKGQRGFHPGSLEGHSWCLEKNKIPIMDRESDKFVKKHGKDFSLHYETHSPLCKRPILPLTDKERETHLFHPVKESIETTS